MIGEEEYFDDDIDSIDDEEEFILEIKKYDRVIIIEEGLQQPLYIRKDEQRRRQVTRIRPEPKEPK